jgi:hypothetical protein
MSPWVRIARLLAGLAGGLLFASSAFASFHGWRIEQLFSNHDGTIQFVVLHESLGLNSEGFVQGFKLTVTGGNSFTFDHNLPSPTSGKRMLIATPGFRALNLVTPDYEIPNGFLPIGGGTLNYAGIDSVTYGPLPTDGVSARNRSGAIIQNVATNFAGVSGSVNAPPPPPTVQNYQAMWWASPPSSESGWGINFAHQGDVIFATWFTYGLDGKPTWFIVLADKKSDRVYSGPVSSVTGPPFNAVPFDPANVVETVVGDATLTFTEDGTTASFIYTINGAQQSKTIVRQEFASPVPTCTWGAQNDLALGTNYQDMWWNSPASSEAGWGINFAHQGTVIFATWFTYGADGKPTWFVVLADKQSNNVYSGPVSSVTGPPYNSVPFDPALVVETIVGNVTLTIVDGDTITFDYTVNDVHQTKTITRQVFVTPGTICH